MFYLKEKYDFDEICAGGVDMIDLDTRKFRCKCPGCGKMVKASGYKITHKLVLADDFSAVYCGKCSKAIRRSKKKTGQSGKSYRVVWNDCEGNEHERWFNTLRDAIYEEVSLKEKYDYAETFDENGEPV